MKTRLVIGLIILFSITPVLIKLNNNNHAVVTQEQRPALRAILADGECPSISMNESSAHSRALAYASADGFQNAQVSESALVTRAQLGSQYNMSPSYVSTCYWYIKMSGNKVHNRWPPGLPATPTPGPGTTYVTMKVVLDAATGYLASKVFATIPLATPATLTPGPSPTMWPFPTADVLPTPTLK